MSDNDSRPTGRAGFEPGESPDDVAREAGESLVDGRYEVLRELGRGGWGIVHLARDVWLDRTVCLKIIAPEHLRNAMIVSSFRREASALAAVRSENVVQIHAFGPHRDTYFFAMEYVRGRNLQHIIDAHSRHRHHVPRVRALSVLRQIARGLGAVHRAGLVHRDVKPSNIVIEDETGRPVLVDFGLAQGTGRAPSAEQELMGTPEFMAPEQIAPDAFGSTGPATDVYALGCVAFELLGGRVPFAGPSPYDVLQMQVEAEAPAISSLRPELAALDAIFARALAKAPVERFATADELASAIEAVTRTTFSILPPPSSEPDDLDAHTIRFRRGPPEAPLRVAEIAEEPPEASPPLRVLIADDDPGFRAIATRAVQLAFYNQPLHVKAVRSGVHAISDAEEKAPSLVLLDHELPDLDGIETLSRLRDTTRGARARVLVMSETITEGAMWRFEVLGVDRFVHKPIGLMDLAGAVADVARRAGWLKT